jgi:hypothetical protein
MNVAYVMVMALMKVPVIVLVMLKTVLAFAVVML